MTPIFSRNVVIRFVLAAFALSSLTLISAIPTAFDLNTVVERSPADDRETGPAVVQADYDWLSYTEKMAIGLFGQIPGLEALRRSIIPTPSPTGTYIYEFYGCFGQGFCNTTCVAYPITDLEEGEALCSQTDATYQRNVMIFDNHTECLNGANVPLSCSAVGAYPFYHYVRVA